MNGELLKQLKSLHGDMREWQEHLHAHPELAMQESETSDYVANLLKEWGYEVHTNIGGNGVVAVMKCGDGSKNLGIRADFDALPIREENDLQYKSKVISKAHLCGHDGHTAMLLGAAKYLSEHKDFNGTLTLIFQPGEETMEGAPAMIKDGLFEKFPVDAVYALHNMPGLELGKMYFREGETMAAVDNWEIILQGKGSHGSMPELSIDPIVAGSSLVMALQTIVSRNLSPRHSAVVSVGAFLAGDAPNVIADSAILRLSIRNMAPEDRKMVLGKIRSITEAQANSFGCSYTIKEGQPGAVLVNTPEETHYAAEVARKTFGEEKVVVPGSPYMGSEDFAFMLKEKPGCYFMLGNGDCPMVHHPNYVFNQEILPIGATFWVALAQDYLS